MIIAKEEKVQFKESLKGFAEVLDVGVSVTDRQRIFGG
jgi:hypothetical protein